MRVSCISNIDNRNKSTYKAKPLVIKADENTHVNYLFNQVKDVVSTQPYKTGATFDLGTPGKITIPSPPKGLKEYLESLKIKFAKEVKKESK